MPCVRKRLVNLDVIFARAVIPASDAPRLCARGTNMRKNGAIKQAMMKVLMSCAVVTCYYKRLKAQPWTRDFSILMTVFQ